MTTDRPPTDDAAEKMLAIAKEARRRSTEVTHLAELCALEINAFAAGDVGAMTTLIRKCVDRAIDAAARWHSEQLAVVVVELDETRKQRDAAGEKLRALRMSVLRHLRGDATARELRDLVFEPSPPKPR